MITLQPSRLALALCFAFAGAPLSALATNGMLLEGYGPISTGMGGASTALENGLAAAINNPATLGLLATNAQLDLAIGKLGPRVSSSAGPLKADSQGRSYVMPAFGYGRRAGAWTWGVALFAQGGMGTEYGANTFLAAGSGQDVRSELGVGRLIFPVAFKASDSLTVGGAIDYVWSTLDLKMALQGPQLGAMVTGGSGMLAGAAAGLAAEPWARIDFSDDNDFSGAAKSGGYAAKLGLVYQATPSLRVGASYHSKTQLKDMRTGGSGAAMSASNGFADTGRITVEDFQMPEQWALGLAWQASPQTLLAADVKHIGWSDVMSSFRMTYATDGKTGMDGSISFALPQLWKDQTVLNLGVQHRLSPQWAVRAGLNMASNPVPDATVNPLFPAIVERHYTAGVGYKLEGAGEINASLTLAPKATANTPQGVVISHRQLNGQLMYSHPF